MQQYVDLGKRILAEGTQRYDRTGVGTLSVFDAHLTFDLRESFPLVTVKETRWKTAFLEMLFFLAGETNVKWLNDFGCKLWDDWADENGNLGPVYGFGWRKWGERPDNVPQPVPALREGVCATKLGIANGDGGRGSPLHSVWANMISRCYDKTDSQYKAYGAKGVSVCNEWLEFRVFEQDVKNLEGFKGSKPSDFNLDLDKDILGNGFVYSPDTCCWLDRNVNRGIGKLEYEYEFERLCDGKKFVVRNAKNFAKEQGILNFGSFSALWNDPNSLSRSGFRLVRKDKVKKGIDQVKQVIYQLKTKPESRRMLVTAWNVGELKDMALPPCHWAHQLYSTDGYVDMKLFLRSSDFGLGLPFNVAQYALLLHLYARASGLKARKLIVDIGDAHIYLNHVEKAKMFLERAIIDCKPKLVIDTLNTDIDGYSIDNFSIVGYKHHPHVKLDVAV